MYPDERRIYIALLTVGIIVFLLIVFLISRMFWYQRRRIKTHLITSGEEIKIREFERGRFASDLHDEVNSGLSVIKLKLSMLSVEEEGQKVILSETMAYVDGLSDKVRSLSSQLLPPALEREGLKTALDELISPLLSLPQYRIDYRFEFLSLSLTPEASIHIYRIVQEVISNILRHSKASRIQLRLRENKQTLFIRIEDNGIGFDQASETYRKGLGLQNIRRRADILQAHLYLTAGEDKGTCYEIEIPKRAVWKEE